MKGLSNARSKYKGKITNGVALSIKYEEKLERMSERPKISANEMKEKDIMIAKGIEFSKNGVPLDMVPEELKKYHFFVVGYNIGERQKIVENIQKGRSK